MTYWLDPTIEYSGLKHSSQLQSQLLHETVRLHLEKHLKARPASLMPLESPNKNESENKKKKTFFSTTNDAESSKSSVHSEFSLKVANKNKRKNVLSSEDEDSDEVDKRTAHSIKRSH